MHGHDFHLDAEIPELQLHLARHGFEGGMGDGVTTLLRLVQQPQGRQTGSVRGQIEERHLALLLRAHAGLHRRHRRLDARRQPLLRVFVRHTHLRFPLAPGETRQAILGKAARTGRRPAEQPQRPVSGGVDDGQPREAGEQRET